LDTTAPNILGNLSTTNDQYFSDNKSVQLRQPIVNMQRWLQFEQAKSLVAEAEATLDRDLQNLVVRVAGAYFENLMADEQLELVLAQKLTYSTMVDAAKKGLAAGSGTRTDIDDAQARLDMSRAQELEARQNQDLTRRQLQLLVNQPVPAVAKLNVSSLKLEGPVPSSLEEWTLKAEQHDRVGYTHNNPFLHLFLHVRLFSSVINSMLLHFVLILLCLLSTNSFQIILLLIFVSSYSNGFFMILKLCSYSFFASSSQCPQ
jgi:hypothetical protein